MSAKGWAILSINVAPQKGVLILPNMPYCIVLVVGDEELILSRTLLYLYEVLLSSHSLPMEKDERPSQNLLSVSHPPWLTRQIPFMAVELLPPPQCIQHTRPGMWGSVRVPPHFPFLLMGLTWRKYKNQKNYQTITCYQPERYFPLSEEEKE